MGETIDNERTGTTEIQQPGTSKQGSRNRKRPPGTSNIKAMQKRKWGNSCEDIAIRRGGGERKRGRSQSQQKEEQEQEKEQQKQTK